MLNENLLENEKTLLPTSNPSKIPMVYKYFHRFSILLKILLMIVVLTVYLDY